MDELIKASLDAAALRPSCTRHPERASVASIPTRRMCKECSLDFPWPIYRAVGSGFGPDAAGAQRESKDYQEEYDNLKPVIQSWRVKE